MNPPTFMCFMSSLTGEDPQGDCRGPSPAKSRNGLTLTITSQKITLCTTPKTEPVGDTLQSTVLQPTEDDDNKITCK